MTGMKSRLKWLAAGTMLVLPILSACGGTTATPTTAPAATNTAAMAGETPTTATSSGSDMLAALAAEGITPDTSASGKMEFFSWWTAGGEAEGKNDILNLYKQLYPNVEVVDAAVAGGGGDKAKAVLKTRMQGTTRPIRSSCTQAPNSLMATCWRTDGAGHQYLHRHEDKDAFPAQLLTMITRRQIYSVPANIPGATYSSTTRRSSPITHNRAASWDEFFAAADKLKARISPRLPWRQGTPGPVPCSSRTSC